MFVGAAEFRKQLGAQWLLIVKTVLCHDVIFTAAQSFLSGVFICKETTGCVSLIGLIQNVFQSAPGAYRRMKPLRRSEAGEEWENQSG